MRVAVVGAGLAGLAVTWQLIDQGMNVTVFDAGTSASMASTGLLHPCPGKKALLSDRAYEGIQEAHLLLEKASEDGPVFEKSGILRFATSAEQKTLFGGDTMWIKEGMTVYCRPYLKALKKLCSKALWVNQKIHHLNELEGFDQIILTVGSGALEFADLSLKKTIGQALVCRVKKRLPHAFLGKGHITPTENPEVCLVGSTYEYTSEPDPQKAMQLLDKVAEFYPEAKEFEVLEIISGVRITPKIGYQPILKQLTPKTWILTGLGSRGLMYHALYAKELVQMIRQEQVGV